MTKRTVEWRGKIVTLTGDRGAVDSLAAYVATAEAKPEHGETVSVPFSGMYVDGDGKLWLFAMAHPLDGSTAYLVGIPHGWDGDALNPHPSGPEVRYSELRETRTFFPWVRPGIDESGRPYARPLRSRPGSVHTQHLSAAWRAHCASCGSFIGRETVTYGTTAQRVHAHNRDVHRTVPD